MITDCKQGFSRKEDRAIPSSRKGLDEALAKFGLSNARCLLLRSLGLSLSDQYWMKPENGDLAWEKVNFFQNEFSSDVGDVLFGAEKSGNRLNFSSPDSSMAFLRNVGKSRTGRESLQKAVLPLSIRNPLMRSSPLESLLFRHPPRSLCSSLG